MKKCILSLFALVLLVSVADARGVRAVGFRRVGGVHGIGGVFHGIRAVDRFAFNRGVFFRDRVVFARAVVVRNVFVQAAYAPSFSYGFAGGVYAPQVSYAAPVYEAPVVAAPVFAAPVYAAPVCASVGFAAPLFGGFGYSSFGAIGYGHSFGFNSFGFRTVRSVGFRH